MEIEYWDAVCLKCNWSGSSKDCQCGQIADTGDYEDCRCPKCGEVVEDADEVLHNL